MCGRRRANADLLDAPLAGIHKGAPMRLGTFLLAGFSLCFGGTHESNAQNKTEPSIKNIKVYPAPGRPGFGVAPANHGIWCWGNEILVGFGAGYYKDHGPNLHNIDHDKPE